MEIQVYENQSSNIKFQNNQRNIDKVDIKDNRLDAIYVDLEQISKLKRESYTIKSQIEKFDGDTLKNFSGDFKEIQTHSISPKKVQELLAGDR